MQSAPNDLRFSCGRMPAASEFYVPLIAIGEQPRAEPGAPRARQLQPLVRQQLPEIRTPLTPEPVEPS
jgi:hypothetical protein